jgi:hypothetical protein
MLNKKYIDKSYHLYCIGVLNLIYYPILYPIFNIQSHIYLKRARIQKNTKKYKKIIKY